jgi:hypothetical protein
MTVSISSSILSFIILFLASKFYIFALCRSIFSNFIYLPSDFIFSLPHFLLSFEDEGHTKLLLFLSNFD